MKPLMGNISIEHFLVLGAILFLIGVWGVLFNRKSLITILLAIELMLLAVNINLVSISVHIQDISGQIFTIFILTVAAAEAAIGLAILVCYFRGKGDIDITSVNIMKG